MKLLLDTHTFLWFIEGSSELNSHARAVIEEEENDRYLSMASLWEMAIKVSIGKLERPATDVVRAAQSSFTELLISSAHAATAGQLPMHHRDPFDRVIIAQGQEEECTVVTPDDKFPLYDVDVMDC